MIFLFNTPWYKPSVRAGGPIHSVSALAEALVERGHHVKVLTSNLDFDEPMDVPVGVPVFREGVEVWYFRALPRFGLRRLGFGRVFRLESAASKWIEKEVASCDVVDLHLAFNYTNVAVARAAFQHGKAVFYRQRGNLDPERLKRGKWKKALYIALHERRSFRFVSAALCLTEFEKGTFQKAGLKAPKEVVPNFINLESWPRVALEDKGKRNRVRLLWLGRVHELKGPDLFIRAAVELCREFTSVDAVLAGPDEEGMIPELQELVAKEGFSDRIRFLPSVSGSEKARLFGESDVFILPSRSEGQSMAVLEALASSCAVVFTPGCYCSEIEKEGAGVEIERSVDGIVQGVKRLVTQGGGHLRAAQEKARELAETRFSKDAVVSHYEEVASRYLAANSPVESDWDSGKLSRRACRDVSSLPSE